MKCSKTWCYAERNFAFFTYNFRPFVFCFCATQSATFIWRRFNGYMVSNVGKTNFLGDNMRFRTFWRFSEAIFFSADIVDWTTRSSFSTGEPTAIETRNSRLLSFVAFVFWQYNKYAFVILASKRKKNIRTHHLLLLLTTEIGTFYLIKVVNASQPFSIGQLISCFVPSFWVCKRNKEKQILCLIFF